MRFEKEQLLQLLGYVGQRDRVIIEFETSGEGADTTVYALDITQHVAELEGMIESENDE